MIPGDNHPICIKCGLWRDCRNPFMESSGSRNPDILVVGEAPGEEEDLAGKPFVGRSGKLLRNVLEEMGLDIKAQVRFTNVVRCRPPNNKVEKKHIKACAPFALEDISSSGAQTVLLMGNTPLSAVLKEDGIRRWNGVIVEKDDVRYAPLFHPAYILRNDAAMEEWLKAMDQAVNGQEIKATYERIYPHTLREVREMEKWLKAQEWISYDSETTTLDPFSHKADIIMVSFAAPSRAYAVPLLHSEFKWSDQEYLDVLEIIVRILEDHEGHVRGQNLKFDRNYFAQMLDYRIVIGGDTMLASQVADSRLGMHGLERLAGLHIGMFEYKRPLLDYVAEHPEANPKRGGSYAYAPLKLVETYAAMDAEAVDRLHPILMGKLSKKQVALYEQLVIPVANVLSDIELAGFKIDKYIAQRYQAIYAIHQHDTLEAIRKDSKVKKIEKEQGKIFNPNSSVQLAELLYIHHKIPVPGKTDKGNPSTDYKLLKPMVGKYPILSLIRTYKLMEKMLGTYIEPADGDWISDDGMVHPNFNQHGAITGRTSCSKPNLQNIPTPEKEPGTLCADLPIKNMFTTRFDDGVVVSIDYSGMELRVFSSMAKCTNMLKIFDIGKDVHSMVAIMSTTRKPIMKITDNEILALPKPVRYRYKWTNWTLLYGGDEYTLHNLYDIPMEEAQETVKTYYEVFPEIKEFGLECVEFAEDHGYIESPTGRREYLPYINESRNKTLRNEAVREAKNMPAQAGASDILLLALYIIYCKLRQYKSYNTEVFLVSEVHDSIVLDMRRKHVKWVVELCKDVMENIVEYAKEYAPAIDFSWLCCPLVADADVGTHYGAMVPIEKWEG